MKKLFLLLLLVSSPAWAISGTTPLLNPDSPLVSKATDIAEIYNTACKVGIHDIWARQFPTDKIDKLTDTLFATHKDLPRYIVHSNIFAGLNLGLVLNYTDLTEDYKEELCKRYANLYMSGVVNSPDNQSKIGVQHLPIMPTLKSTIKNDISDDIFRQRAIPAIRATPRVAEQSGCHYMYHVLSSKPIIEFNALDATLEIMMNMMWQDYKDDDIRAAYPFILQGAKIGRLLFESKQSEKLCYD